MANSCNSTIYDNWFIWNDKQHMSEFQIKNIMFCSPYLMVFDLKDTTNV